MSPNETKPGKFLCWIYRSINGKDCGGSCSNRWFEDNDEVIRFGQQDDQIVKIVRTDEFGENEVVIYHK